jgi:ABC-type phosphate transport system substrate-binding protein
MTTLAAPLKVIANASVENTHLKLKDLRSIYTMKKNLWSNGERIVVFVLSDDSTTHKEFCRKLLKVFPRQLESVWYRLVYSGTGERPVTVNSEKEMISLVANTPGAIGYIQTESLHEEAKIITIN